MRQRLKHLAIVAPFLTACGDDSERQSGDPLATLEPGERGRVVRVIDGDALVLDTGLTVRLSAIEAPSPAYRDRRAQPFAEEATRHLEALALGREVRLYYAGLTRDRYDRAIAQVMTADLRGPEIWLNRELILRGAARVRFYPDNEALVADLFSAERTARRELRGIWAGAEAAPKDASTLSRSGTGFAILEGWVVPAQPPLLADRSSRGRVPAVACRLGFGQVTIEVAPAAARACRIAPGTQVRARGWLRDGVLKLDSAANLEVLDE